MADEPQMTFMDNPLAPEVFASRAAGFFVLDGNIVITFESARVDHTTTPGPINRVVIGRLVMSAAGAHNLAVGLFDFMKAQGYDPTAQGEITAH